MKAMKRGRHAIIWMGVVTLVLMSWCRAISDDRRIESKPVTVDPERFADFMAHEARDVRDLAAGAELQRRTFDRITPAGVAWFQPMQPAVVPFAAANFDAAFLEDLLGEERNSVAVYPLVLALDPQTRATLVRNVEGKLLATVPASKDFRWGPAGADPARVTLQVDLLPAEDVEPYLYAEDRIAQSLAAAAAKTRKPTRAGTVAARSLSAGEFGFAGVQHPTNGNFRLTVTNGTDAAEIYSCTVWHTSAVVVVTWTNEASNVVTDTNVVWTPVSPAFAGIESAWEIAATNLALTNGVGVWEDANVSSNARIRFYAAAKRVDSDGDGLTDGAETFLHRTDPGVADTDGDGMPDGWEVRNGLNARSGLADSLIGWWKLDDGAGTAAVNSAQDAYHGELVGFSGADGGWTTEGRLGGALRFDGLDDWVRIAQEAMLPTGGAFTISAWVKLDGTCTSDWPEAVGDMVDATWNGYCLGGDASHAAFAMVGPTAWIQDTNSMADEWTWLALEFDGADMRLYRDGAALGDPVPATFVPATNGYVAIGNGPDAGTSERWKGLIDDVRIYGAALGTNDLADLCAAWEDPDGDGLLNVQESQHGSNPFNVDSDSDGLDDYSEIHIYGTDPVLSDTDEDGMPDSWEIENGFDPNIGSDGEQDADGDGLANAQEYSADADPYLFDSDGDGLCDGEDSTPATGSCTLGKEMQYYLPPFNRPMVNGNTGYPVYAGTVCANPTGFVGNVIAITNIMLTGVVDDCFMINGHEYAWQMEAKEFATNITGAVTDLLAGTFAVDIYDYITDHVQNQVALLWCFGSSVGARCEYQYDIGLSVNFSDAQDWECWSQGGTYNARSRLATDSYTGDRVYWSITNIVGSPATIDASGFVVFGEDGGRYRIGVTSVDTTNCFATMTLVVPKVDIEQACTNICMDCGGGVTLNVTSNSYSPGGYVWSSVPAGICGSGPSITLSSSNLAPGTYTVYAKSAPHSTCQDLCTVNVLKVDLSTNLWWFAGENPGGGYEIQATLTAAPVTTGTFKWDVIAGTSIVDLNNGGADADSITAADDNNVTVKSTGSSSSIGDVTIALTYNGVAVCSYDLTVRKPGTPQLLAGFPTDAPWMLGYISTYRFKVLDQFGADVPFDMPVNESFGTWTSDLWYELWPEPTPNGTITQPYLGIAHQFKDEYGASQLVPSSVDPSDPAAGESVQHATQYYRAGSLTPGAGILIKQHTVQMFRGYSRQQ